MKKLRPLIYLLGFAILITSCKHENAESKKEGTPPNKGRNMFGMGIPRGLTKTTEGLTDGYVLFPVTNSPYVDLVNRKGEVVHQWKSNYATMGAHMNDDGSIFLSAYDPDFPTFGFGGPFGRLQKISWDGKMLWDFELADENQIAHHDFTVMPNGHLLAIVYETKSYEEAIARGRNPERTPKDGPWLEKIIEIEPVDTHHAKIVWEWHVWDHLIQNTDNSKLNYGIPREHPELLDFDLGRKNPPTISEDSLEILKARRMEGKNTTVGNRGADIFHFNAIKYNPTLDQIVFSSPNLNEIFIIDHSTSTKEAVTHKGGRSGKGGDLLYRWGNPKNYQRADSTARQLFGQHDVRWIEEGKPGAGHLTVFNNYPPTETEGGKDSLNYSAIFEIVTPVDEKGNYFIGKNEPFGPAKPAWVYTAPDKLSFYSSFISGAQRMENGNTFINEGAKGRYFEVTPDGKIVWEYLNPYRGNIQSPSGDFAWPPFMTHATFRSNFIMATHPAFKDKKLEPLNPQPELFKPAAPKKEEKK